MGNKSNQAPAKKPVDKSLIILCSVGIIVVAAIVIAIVCLAVSSSKQDDAPGQTSSVEKTEVNMDTIAAEINSANTEAFAETEETTDYVKITVKDHGDIIVRLREDIAPITVKNFKELVGEDFYNGLTFHRVVSHFMIQGGDPEGNGSGGSDEKIKGEFSENGVDNDLSHIRGVISMARRSDNMDSASCQFFICTTGDYAQSSLDGKYASFGYVVAGMSTVDSIAEVEVKLNSSLTEKSVPVEDVIIEKICFVEKK